MEKATQLLGHHYSLEGKIVKGNQVGRTLGFPTLNLDADKQLIPASGVYCGRIWLRSPSAKAEAPVLKVDESLLLKAVFSIGSRPTFHAENETPPIYVEAHSLDPLEDKKEHYSSQAAFFFERNIRDMIKFNSIEDLKKQIHKDVLLARKLL